MGDGVLARGAHHLQLCGLVKAWGWMEGGLIAGEVQGRQVVLLLADPGPVSEASPQLLWTVDVIWVLESVKRSVAAHLQRTLTYKALTYTNTCRYRSSLCHHRYLV